MLKFVKLLIGIALLPFAVAVTLSFIELIGHGDWQQLEQTTRWFIGGFAIWVVLFFALPRPVHSYILAHELTHAVWGLVMGAKVSRLRVSEKGGSVTLTKSNIWITLAPYFFPFYSILALGLYVLLSLKLDMSQYLPFWYAVFGLTWSFHLTFTINMIGGHQPDIREHGRLFSYAVIYIINLLTAIFLIALLAEHSLSSLPATIWNQIQDTYLSCWNRLAPYARQLLEKIENLVK